MSGPRVLLIDIETTPTLAYTWGLFDQNIGLNQIVKPTKMLCFAAKWLGSSKVIFERDADMVDRAHELLNEADAVIHFNGTSFDEKHLNREFIEAGLGPTSPYQTIDLYRVCRSKFRFLSNKLDHITQQLGLEGKVQHEGFSLWTGCMEEDPAAWRKMKTYNRRDVTLLEDLYHELRPWIKNHPNLQHWTKENTCPRCTSDNLIRRGFHRTSASVFQTYQCKDCGGYHRDKVRASAFTTSGRPV